MPAKSKAQCRAMGAALGGHSKLGIPKSVAKEYLEHSACKNLPERKHEKESKRKRRKGRNLSRREKR